MAMGKLTALLVGAAGLQPGWALRAKGSQQEVMNSTSALWAKYPAKIPDEDLQRPTCAGIECLERYVNQEDGAFSWKPFGQLQGNSSANTTQWSALVLNVTSQKWMTEADIDPPIWWHLVAIITPSNLGALGRGTEDWATLIVGRLGRTMVTVNHGNQDLEAGTNLAMATGARAVVLFQDPNYPTLFASDPTHEVRGEEDEKAWTWYYAGEHPERPEYALEMPMTKAVVKTMDAVQEATNNAVRRFVISGFSKRGITTILTGAIDKRVQAIMSGCHALAFRQQALETYKSLGHLPRAALPYAKLPHSEHQEEPSGKSLSGYIDPVSNSSASPVYISRLERLRKMFMDAGNDDYSLVDNAKNWVNKLRGQMTYVMQPNSRHLGGFYWDSFLPNAIGFVQGTIMHKTVPKIGWHVNNVTGSIMVRQMSNHTPVMVKFWTAHSCPAAKRRDFRLYTSDSKEVCEACGGKFDADGEACLNSYSKWSSEDLTEEEAEDGGRIWVADVKAPPSGWTAGFVEMTYNWPKGREGFRATTEVSVMPKEYPFTPCKGDECKEAMKVMAL